MIEIFPNSLTSIFVTTVIKAYFLIKNIRKKSKLSLYYHPYKSDVPTTYFIIKSKLLTSDQMAFYLQDIRAHSDLANIIIIGSHIELFKDYYRAFGVIDTTENNSLKIIQKQIHFYLDGLYSVDV
ncbi:hypothetical protein GUT184_11630 [Streptococcus ruminantium]|nr:hypothetical protein GUT184_11630 [Streptococcus ruminantium]